MKTMKYIYSVGTDTFMYRTTVIELVRRGYRFSDAKAMVRASNIVDDAKTCLEFTHDMGIKEWADYVLETCGVSSDGVRYGA